MIIFVKFAQRGRDTSPKFLKFFQKLERHFFIICSRRTQNFFHIISKFVLFLERRIFSKFAGMMENSSFGFYLRDVELKFTRNLFSANADFTHPPLQILKKKNSRKCDTNFEKVACKRNANFGIVSKKFRVWEKRILKKFRPEINFKELGVKYCR